MIDSVLHLRSAPRGAVLTEAAVATSDLLTRAGRWFLESGIMQTSGGVARYYAADSKTYKPVSTEITGYAASVFVWLYRTTGDEQYLDAARSAANFLVREAWEPKLGVFPFEFPPRFAYFFDSGIIIRGLLAVWRETQEPHLLEIAAEASHAMIRDHRAGRCYHPVLRLPDKRPVPREPRWSRESGCYQLKAALAWWEVAEITGDTALRSAFEGALAVALASHCGFLPGSGDRDAVMDRLHAYCYFLEALVPFLDRESCAAAYQEGIDRVAELLRDIAPDFARSDVYAQLLRARLAGIRAVPLDVEAAAHEAAELECFQLASEDPRIESAWCFGRRDDVFSPHINPVSTAFALEALELWRAFEAGDAVPCQTPV